jgi:hypothetical protein
MTDNTRHLSGSTQSRRTPLSRFLLRSSLGTLHLRNQSKTMRDKPVIAFRIHRQTKNLSTLYRTGQNGTNGAFYKNGPRCTNDLRRHRFRSSRFRPWSFFGVWRLVLGVSVENCAKAMPFLCHFRGARSFSGSRLSSLDSRHSTLDRQRSSALDSGHSALDSRHKPLL